MSVAFFMYIPCIFIVYCLFVPIYVHLMVQVNNMSVATQKCRLFNAAFGWGAGKNQPETGQKSIEDIPVLSHFSLLRNPRLKPTGVLEHCRKGETNCWFSIFRGVSFWPDL